MYICTHKQATRIYMVYGTQDGPRTVEVSKTWRREGREGRERRERR